MNGREVKEIISVEILKKMQDGEDVYIISEQARNIDRGRLVKKMGELSERESQKVKDKFFELIK